MSLCIVGLAKHISIEILSLNKVFSKVHYMYLVIRSSETPSVFLKFEEHSESKYATLPRRKCLLPLLFPPKLAWLKDYLLSNVLGKRSGWFAFFCKAVQPSP